MNKPINLLIIIFLSIAGCDSSSNQATLRYDGLYRSTTNVSTNPESWSYFRFYPDGIVLEVNSTGQPKDIQKWFARERYNKSIGRFTIQDNRLSFYTVSESGRIDYTGAIKGNQLHLQSYCRMNQHKKDTVFVFVNWLAEQNSSMTIENR